jgi:ATP-dependent DNA helicase RecQ
MDGKAVLKQYFGHTEFRAGQEPLVNALLSGRDVLGVMPTGAGKSMCYQIPALLLPGVTVVVSPLISLMKDQVTALVQAGIPAAYLNSTLTAAQYETALNRARQGAYRILYVAPERLETGGFRQLMQDLTISLVAVDEAHCVSQWGQDFRPSYLQIAAFLARLPRRPVVGAFTATATAQVSDDIVRLLELRDPLRVTTGFDRPNLSFEVVHPRQKSTYLYDYVERRKDRCGIVYCATRKTVEMVCAGLTANGISATSYHAGLADEVRRENQEDFVYDRKLVMVATNAFGMGIDKSNVSYVVHYNMPKNLESYYQEAGRAGRDGEPAECVLLFAPGDVQTAKYLIENSHDNDSLSEAEREQVLLRDRERLEKMVGYCKTTSCLRSYILEYFGQEPIPDCGNCGNCRGEYEERDITIEAKKILSAVARVEQNYSYGLGANLVIQMLRGSQAQRVLQLGLDKLSTYGIMKEVSQDSIHRYIDLLVEQGYLERTGDEYPVLRRTRRAGEVLFHGAKVAIKERIPSRAERKGERKQPVSELSIEENSLFETLRTLRMELAQQEGVPAYVIFSNATLADMAVKRPHLRSELMEVSGVGHVKAERYGARFLKAIRAWEESEQ